METGKLPKPFFVLAPMDEVTDTVFRQIVASCAPPDLFFTEFVNVDGLMSAGRQHLLKKLRFAAEEGRVVVQLWGMNPDNFRAVADQIASGTIQRELGLPLCPVHHSLSGDAFSRRSTEGAVQEVQQLSTGTEKSVTAKQNGSASGSARGQAGRCVCGFAGIDLNMGCPAKSEVKNGACSALIRRESWPLAGEIIRAAQAGAAGRLPVSVKTRVGFSAVDMEWFDFLLQFGLDMLTVHGRTRKQMSKVPADWGLIGQVREKRDAAGVQTLIVGNGDVQSRVQGLELAQKYQLDGIMIGRGIFHDPFIFQEDGPIEWGSYSKKQRIDLYKRHVELFAATWQAGERPVVTLNKFCKVYIQCFDGAAALRAALMLAGSTDEIIALLDNHLAARPVASPQPDRYDEAMSETIKAIVFDADGTLLDTRELIIEGYKTVLSRHKLEHLASDHYIRQRLGKPVPETYEQIIAGHHVHLSVEELAAEHDGVQNAMVDRIRPYPHTEQVLRDWKDKGVKLCLFTSGKRMMIERNFAGAGMPSPYELFDAIITADDEIARKPEPDAITELLRRVEVEPQNAVVVGDHAYDIIAGARAQAGLKVGILHGFGTSHELLGAGADFLADNLESLNHLMNFATN